MSTRFNHQDGQQLPVDDALLYVEQQGNPDGPPLLFLHGGFGDISTYNLITPALAPHYRLIGLDSRGHGRSTAGKVPLSYLRLQEDVQAVTRQLGLARYGVIGFSDGGIVGLRLAAQPDSPVERLVSIGGHWQLAPDDPTRALFARISSAFWQREFPQEYAQYHALNPAPDFDALAGRIKAMWLDDSEAGYPGDRVRQIRARLLAIHGEDDPVVIRSNPLELVERVPGARLLWLPMTGHAAQEERPDWITPVIRAFLAQP